MTFLIDPQVLWLHSCFEELRHKMLQQSLSCDQFSSKKARLKTVNPSLAVPPSSFFWWVSDHPASSPEMFSWHGVPSRARTVALQRSCDGIWLPRSMGGPGISAHLRVSPHEYCTWPRRLQTWDTDRAGGVPFHLTRVFATKKMH